MKHNASSIYLQNDGFWHQFNPLFHGSPLLSNSSLMKASYHVWMMSKSQKSRKYFIHGSHTDFLMSHRNHENLKIIFNENLFCVIRVLRGLLLDDDAEGGAVMGFGGFDEEAFLATTKLESMV